MGIIHKYDFEKFWHHCEFKAYGYDRVDEHFYNKNVQKPMLDCHTAEISKKFVEDQENHPNYQEWKKKNEDVLVEERELRGVYNKLLSEGKFTVPELKKKIAELKQSKMDGPKQGGKHA